MHIYRTRSTATTYIRFSAKERQELDKEMEEFKCKLVCECGYFASCSDYY